jgi:hypothetical protein
VLFDIKKRVAGGSYSRTKFSTKFSTELSTPSEHRILEFRICQLNRMCVCVHTHSFNNYICTKFSTKLSTRGNVEYYSTVVLQMLILVYDSTQVCCTHSNIMMYLALFDLEVAPLAGEHRCNCTYAGICSFA